MLIDVVEHKHRVRLAPREIPKTRTKVVLDPSNKGCSIDLLLGHVTSWDNKVVEIAGQKQRKVLIVIKRISQRAWNGEQHKKVGEGQSREH